jgi:hypothetical protein
MKRGRCDSSETGGRATHNLNLTPRQRVETVLRGGHGDRVPFTVYECMIPQCTAERELRNRGLCIVKRDVRTFKTVLPNVKMTKHAYWEQGREFTRTTYETPVGPVTTLYEEHGFTQWYHERLFKSPDDYARLLFLIEDEVYVSDYANFARAQRAFGPDGIFRAQIGLEPLQALISGNYMDTQTFCIEWMDRRDEVLTLYDALVKKRREIYRIVADSPALHANYGGNVVPEIIGLKNFQQYYVPHYNEAAEILHQKGKLIGSHFDANCRLLADAIAATNLDYIEAFTPAPDTDMTLREAREAWPDKVIWINFPSSVHLRPDEEVEQTTVDLLSEVGTIEGLIVGITEDVPQDRWQDSCRAIMDGLERHAIENAPMYQAETWPRESDHR